MLSWNRRKVQQLSGTEIWLFIVGRVLAALGVGLLLPSYLPDSRRLGLPAVIVGVVLLLVAARGLKRKPPAQ
jgi:hypothetical protein